MKLLLLTQKVDRDDDVLGFVHAWIKNLAPHWEEVIVVCLYEGKHELPSNVRVLSLGKEGGASRLKYVARLFSYVWRERRNYDRVFVHMNPEYLVLAGWLWKLLRKPVSLWYAHKSFDLKLKIALIFVDRVFSPTEKSVSFASPKLMATGHGIDTTEYRCSSRNSDGPLTLVSVGRITPIKNCEVLLRATEILRSSLNEPFRVVFVGKPVSDADEKYFHTLQSHVEREGLESIVAFTGSVPLEELRGWYCKADIAVNMVPTGGLDKAAIEPMVSGALVLSSNEAFKEYFGPYADRLWFPFGDAEELAQRIRELWSAPDREAVRQYLLKESERFDVSNLMRRLSEEMQGLSRRV